MLRWQVLNFEGFALFVAYSLSKREKVAIITPFLMFFGVNRGS